MPRYSVTYTTRHGDTIALGDFDAKAEATRFVRAITRERHDDVASVDLHDREA